MEEKHYLISTEVRPEIKKIGNFLEHYHSGAALCRRSSYEFGSGSKIETITLYGYINCSAEGKDGYLPHSDNDDNTKYVTKKVVITPKDGQYNALCKALRAANPPGVSTTRIDALMECTTFTGMEEDNLKNFLNAVDTKFSHIPAGIQKEIVSALQTQIPLSERDLSLEEPCYDEEERNSDEEEVIDNWQTAVTQSRNTYSGQRK